MTSNKEPSFKPHAARIPATTPGGTAPPKRSPPLDVWYTLSHASVLDPTTTIDLPYYVPRNTTTPVPTNTTIDRNKAFKNTANNIIEAITYLTAYMSNEPETVLL